MIRLALARPVATVVLALTLATLGAVSLARLPVSLLPALDRPSLVVEARAEGRSRDEMLHGLTEPLERSLASLPQVTSVSSETGDGFLRLVLGTEWQADADRLRIEAERRLAVPTSFRPDERQVSVTGGDLSPVVEVAVLGGPSGAARTTFAEKVLLPELARLPGAGRVTLLGRTPRHVVVRPLAAALMARGLTSADVVDRLRLVGRAGAAGRVKEGDALRPLLVVERVRSLRELLALEIGRPGGGRPGDRSPAGSGARLGDVAAVAEEEVSDGTAFREGGEPGVLLRVYRSPAANAVALAAAARTRSEELSRRAPRGLSLRVVADRSREVKNALFELALAAGSGILLGTLVLRAFLGSWRPTLSLSLVIPVSLLLSFGAFHTFGIPLDVVSLAGLALAAGMLVDNSIVVAEAIEVARERGDADAALSGARQIAVAVTASCLATVVVFLPLLYLRGLARAFFGEQAFAVVSSLGASLLLSLTLTPVLARRSPGVAVSASLAFGRRAYERLLGRALHRPSVVLVLALAVTLVSGASALRLPRRLFPEAKATSLRVSYRLPDDLAPEEADRRAVALETRLVASLPGPVRRLSLRGLPESPLPGVPGRSIPTRGELEVAFETPALRERAEATLREAAAGETEAQVTVATRPGAFVEAATSDRDRLLVVVSAPDEARLAGLAERVSALLLARTGRRARPVLDGALRAAHVVLWDEQALARLSVSRSALEGALADALTERAVGLVDLPDTAPEIRVKRAAPEDLGLVPLRAGDRVVPLAGLARLSRESSPPRLVREGGRPALRLSFPDGDALTVSRLLRELPLAADESARVAGEALETVEAFSELSLALGLALVLVVLVIAAFYESVLVPLVVLGAVPVAAGGALALLALTGGTLDVLSMLGLLLLLGIVANHTIVLVDRIERLRAEGVPEDEAIARAGAERYRPVLMTTLTTLLGMLPLALLGGEGVELRRALAVTVLGGLLTSTAATLVLVPLLHRAVDPWRRR